MGNKSRHTKDLLHIGVYDPDWTLASQVDSNPMAWLVSVNGFLLDARTLPRPIQEEAFRRGLIPYIPGVEDD